MYSKLDPALARSAPRIAKAEFRGDSLTPKVDIIVSGSMVFASQQPQQATKP